MKCPTPSLASSQPPALTDDATLAAALDSLNANVSLKMQGPCTLQTLFQILLRAASRADSIEHTTEQLTDVPCGNGIRHHLNKLDDMDSLEEQLNRALQHRLPSKVRNHRHKLAIDLHLIPYYGQPNPVSALYIYRSQVKASTTSFFAYASIYLIRRHHRVTLAVHPVRADETLVATITYLLAQLTPLHIKVQHPYLDRGFYGVPVIRWLKALRIPFIMAAIVRGKRGGTRQFCRGRRSYFTAHTLTSGLHGSVDCLLAVICCYQRGRWGRRGVDYLLYVVHNVRVALHGIRKQYSQRFGIETSYRLKNSCRIRTTTRNPAIRLLFVALAFVLVNLWVYLLWTCLSRPRRGGRKVERELFPLKTMLEFISQAVEKHFPLCWSICLLATP
ncbi:MAG: transposase [Cyanobacteria bacterium P01_E01_bin.34]